MTQIKNRNIVIFVPRKYEENLENTQKAVAMAKKTGASVEAELGSMGRRESGAGNRSGAEDVTKIYTDPDQAQAFVRDSGIDALACSFGTTHGIYLAQPRLDFNVVKNVRALTGNIPVVMHGGSGVSKEDFRRAIMAGVRKINYFTYMDKAGGNAAAAYLYRRCALLCGSCPKKASSSSGKSCLEIQV